MLLSMIARSEDNNENTTPKSETVASDRVKNNAEEGQFGMKEEDPHVVQLVPRHHGPRGSRRKRGRQGETTAC